MMRFTRSALLLALLLSAVPAMAQSEPPPAPREFRGVWVATVSNLNWPSKPGLPVEQQQKEIIDLLDYAVSLRLNAVFVQVRPSADALYKSDLEPWSAYLTGTQGQPPTPFYDPLEFWITEAHRRGIELHAWYNLYRARPSKRGNLAANHVARAHPNLVRDYGEQVWMDPGEPAAARQTLAVILDIVRRYDVDGIHTDDYYYPYIVKDEATSRPVDFPDDQTYQRYRAGGGKLSVKDWRRQNINQVVERVYVESKKIKPWIKVSYAPFGIWKTGTPRGVKGMSQYDELYSDAKLWLNKGWLDFLSPQLYWAIDSDQPFPTLLDWWVNESTQRRPIWPGMSVGKFSADELLNQVELARQHPGSRGVLLWSIRTLRGHKDKLGEQLVTGPFRTNALVPAMPWIDDRPPPPPTVRAQRAGGDALTVTLSPGPGEPAANFAVWSRYGGGWRFLTIPGGAPSVTLNADPTAGPAQAVVVTAVDRAGNESPRVTAQAR